MAYQYANATRKDSGPFDAILIIGGTAAMGWRAKPAYSAQVSNIAGTLAVGEENIGLDSGAYRPIVLHMPSEGGGQDVFERGDRRFDWSDGQIATQYPNRLQLASKWNSTDATQTATCRRTVDLEVGNKFTFVGKATTCRVYNHNSATWANVGTFTNSVLSLATDGTTVFAALGATEDYWISTNGTSFSQPASGKKFNCFEIFNKELYAAVGQVLYKSVDLGATAKGWGAVPVAIGGKVGRNSTSITDLCAAGGVLYIGKPEGLWAWDGENLWQVINAKETVALNNFVGMTESGGYLYYGILQDVFKLPFAKGAAPQKITPGLTGDANKELYGHGTPKVFVSANSGVYGAFHQGEGTYPEILFQPHGNFEWHQIYRGSSSTNLNAFGFSQVLGRLFVNDGSTRYKRVTNVGNSEYPDYNTSGAVIFPLIDGGFEHQPKVYHEIRGKTTGCSANKTVTLAVDVDREGSYSSLPAITTNGVFRKHIRTSAGAAKVGAAANLKVTLATNDAQATPRVEDPIVVMVKATPKANDALDLTLYMDEEKQMAKPNAGRWKHYTTKNAADEFLEDFRASITEGVLILGSNEWIPCFMSNRSDQSRVLAGEGRKVRDAATTRLSVFRTDTGLKRTVEDYLKVDGSISIT